VLTVDLQQKAKHALDVAESDRQKAERESVRIAEELKATQEKRNAEEQARIDGENKRLEQESAAAKAQLKAAEIEKHQLEAAKKDFEMTMAGIRDEAEALGGDTEQSEAELRLRAELESHNAKLEAANAELDAAVRAKAEADQAKVVVEKKVAAQQAVEEELRLQLYEEMEAWLDEERAHSEEELENARKLAEEEEARKRRVETDREREAEATAELLLDVHSLLDDAQAELNPSIIAQATAEERAKLARTAKQVASTEKEKAKRALQAARAKVTSLKRP
jgi:hypothetical protein